MSIRDAESPPVYLTQLLESVLGSCVFARSEYMSHLESLK